eukprot:TRINITY_DN2942_c0_g1_i4.p1 TRINITY_DN2942_c0_g1~~TRINITY_DN2942_c0_g1_i4.p1  ORF type:complete len:310 (-),score=56.43 TRINITY_DN2942_c0_g1_i4:42-971(-)
MFISPVLRGLRQILSRAPAVMKNSANTALAYPMLGRSLAASSFIPSFNNINHSPLLTGFSQPKASFGTFKINRSQKPFKRWRIVRGDRVYVRSGKDKGKSGTVIRVYRKSNLVLVRGINIKFKRMKANMEKDQKGGVKTIIHPVHVSKLMLIDPESGKPVRIRFGFLADGKKVRISKKSGTIVPKPALAVYQVKVRNKNKVDGPKDTPGDKVLEITYKGEDFDKIKREFEEFIQQKERREKLLVFKEQFYGSVYHQGDWYIGREEVVFVCFFEIVCLLIGQLKLKLPVLYPFEKHTCLLYTSPSPRDQA